MSTKFYEAQHPTHSVTCGLVDTDIPFSLFKEAHRLAPLDEWTFNLLDSQGNVLQSDISWREIHVGVTIGAIFG